VDAAAAGNISDERRDSILRMVTSFDARTGSPAQWQEQVYKDCTAAK
jgi:hypothetical protein